MAKAPGKLKKRVQHPRGPNWDWTHGFTQSSIEAFLACREQFALSYIEGWTPRGFSVPLEFGTMFHLMLEKTGTDTPARIARDVTQSYHDARKKTLNGDSFESFQQTLASVQAIFPLYCEYWTEDDAKVKWLDREHIFKLTHEFEDCEGQIRTVPLTGMRDGDYVTKNGGVGLFETKTKSTIDDTAVQDALRADLQTMMYLYSLWKEKGKYPAEITYNVVRRPQLRKKDNETHQQFGERISDDIQSRPDWYFRRYRVTVVDGDIQSFIQTTLDPVLRLAYQWWGSIKDDPFQRWGSPYHFRNLLALTTRYGKAPLYNLMLRGRTNEYYRRSSPFPELNESLQEA